MYYGLICQELERVGTRLRSFASVRLTVMYPIWDFGMEEQKQRCLPGMTSGEPIGCFGPTEPDYDPIQGTWRPRLRTRETICSMGPRCDHERKHRGPRHRLGQAGWCDRGFIVEKDDEGFSAPEMTGHPQGERYE